MSDEEANAESRALHLQSCKADDAVNREVTDEGLVLEWCSDCYRWWEGDAPK